MGDSNAPACPSADALGAFIEGRMGAVERQDVEKHLASCSECAYAVGGTVRLLSADEEESGEPADEAPKRRTTVAAVAAVLAALMLLVIVWRGAIERDPIRPLQRAVAGATTRSVEGHLVAFSHARFRAPRSDTRTPDPAVRIEAERIARLRGDDAATTRARGVAALVLGRNREAITQIERAIQLSPRNATYWSDLSAALLSEPPHANRFRAALAAADRAIEIDPSLAAAHFNRGLALERLGHAGAAAAAYGRSGALDSDADWAAEAHRRQESLSR